MIPGGPRPAVKIAERPILSKRLRRTSRSMASASSRRSATVELDLLAAVARRLREPTSAKVNVKQVGGQMPQ